MISLHLNNGNDSGVQVYIPNNCDTRLAETISNNLYNMTNLEFGASNKYKKKDGVFYKFYDKDEILASENLAKKKGYEPYNLSSNTTTLYTIREVGGIATNAYMDGRNTDYSPNKYYNSNQGIECYQIYLGSIKADLDTILNQKEELMTAISNAF